MLCEWRSLKYFCEQLKFVKFLKLKIQCYWVCYGMCEWRYLYHPWACNHGNTTTCMYTINCCILTITVVNRSIVTQQQCGAKTTDQGYPLCGVCVCVCVCEGMVVCEGVCGGMVMWTERRVGVSQTLQWKRWSEREWENGRGDISNLAAMAAFLPSVSVMKERMPRQLSQPEFEFY